MLDTNPLALPAQRFKMTFDLDRGNYTGRHLYVRLRGTGGDCVDCSGDWIRVYFLVGVTSSCRFVAVTIVVTPCHHRCHPLSSLVPPLSQVATSPDGYSWVSSYTPVNNKTNFGDTATSMLFDSYSQVVNPQPYPKHPKHIPEHGPAFPCPVPTNQACSLLQACRVTPVFQQYLYYGRVDQSDASAACPGNYNTFR